MIGSNVLADAVEEKGFYLLEILTDVFGANIQEDGAEALAFASSHLCHDKKVVNWLIRRGADVKDAVKDSTDPGQYSAISEAIKHICRHEKSLFEGMRLKGWAAASPEMLMYLNRRATNLKCRPFEIHAFRFLQRSLEYTQRIVNCQRGSVPTGIYPYTYRCPLSSFLHLHISFIKCKP